MSACQSPRGNLHNTHPDKERSVSKQPTQRPQKAPILTLFKKKKPIAPNGVGNTGGAEGEREPGRDARALVRCVFPLGHRERTNPPPTSRHEATTATHTQCVPFLSTDTHTEPTTDTHTHTFELRGDIHVPILSEVADGLEQVSEPRLDRLRRL
jgi:hypothetical protein